MGNLSKSEVQNIAKAMIAASGLVFDNSNTFQDCNDMINENDKDLITAEIQRQCMATISTLEKKIGRKIDYRSTENIIESIYYENEK
ncbi:hypothetical protein J2810_004587 [Chryseobacterium rhizosphaerae]|uniref:hypothetical protein n=1 Tax=Chryseobacterium rhizosphaerae TaxID=395937 RepID=UPI0028632E85|nr:hypothetical protein [Chryseobacterium rhizosphaerae]MDR6548497.1 hypothetical protein [Chryseobacterium rhizosphaerae]